MNKLITLVIILLTLALPANAQSNLTLPGVTNDVANLRTGPDTTYELLRVLPPDQPITLVGRDTYGVWFYATLDDDTGWLFYSVIDVAGDPNTLPKLGPDGQPPPVYGATTNVVNFRVAPDADAEVIDALPTGTQVILRGKQDDWVQVEFNGETGWVFAELIDADIDLETLSDDENIEDEDEVSPPTDENPAARAATTIDLANLREGPSADTALIRPLPGGTMVEPRGRDTSGGWIYVDIDEEQGWVRALLLTGISLSELTVIDTEPMRSGLPGRATDILNLRAGPDTLYPVTDVVPENTELSVTGRSGDWLQVTVGEVQGWLFGEYVEVVGDVNTLPDLDIDGLPIGVTNDIVNFRSEPDIAAEVINILETGTTVRILESSDEWLRVTVEDESGWVYADYIDVIQ